MLVYVLGSILICMLLLIPHVIEYFNIKLKNHAPAYPTYHRIL